MKLTANHKPKTTLALTALLGGLALSILLPVSPARAQAQASGLITLDTSGLFGKGVFYLDFQFLDGNGTGDGNAQVSLSQLSFVGANKINTQALTGGASGDPTQPGGLTLNDADPSGIAECIQGFAVSSATSQVQFAYNATATSLDSFAPDQFNFLILQSDKVTPLSTTGPNGVEVVSLILDSTTPAAQGYGTIPGSGGILPMPTLSGSGGDSGSSTAAPEPDSGVLAMGCLSAAGLVSGAVRRRRFRAAEPVITPG